MSGDETRAGVTRVGVDGEDFSGHYTDVVFASKRLQYDVTTHDDEHRHYVLGPQGFQIAFTSPSPRLRTLLLDGEEHRFAVRTGGQMLRDTAVFQREGAYGGVSVLVCCRPAGDVRAQWTCDPLVR